MKRPLTALLCCALLSSCAIIEPMELPTPEPESNITEYSNALDDFGRLLAVYRDAVIFVQSKTITDATGIASATGGEIPYDITEMVRSAINKIGDRVVYVPHDPAFMVNEMHLGSSFKRPLPNLLLSAAITEYDRSLTAEGESLELQGSVGGGTTETDAGFDTKGSFSISRMTVDMNLIDYHKMVMLPKMQSINSIQVYNAKDSASIALAMNGSGFGFSTHYKRVQGRHAAVRLLVELSILEIVGRYAAVPYWRVVDGTKVDHVVIERLEKFFEGQTEEGKIKAVQQLLPYYGHKSIKETGQMDMPTSYALAQVAAKLGTPIETAELFSTYKTLYLNIPYE